MEGDLLKFLAVLWVFVSTVFIFPPLWDACNSFNASNEVAPIVSAFPIIFLIVNCVLPLYLALGKGD